MFNKTLHIFIILSVCVFFLNPLSAVEVKKKEVRQFDDFQQGEFKGTGLDSRGRLFIGPKMKLLSGPDKEYYLSLDVVSNGDVYVGTGHRAAVYKVSPNNIVTLQEQDEKIAEEIFSCDDLDVYALVAKDNGDVFAATSPDGKIYKISGKDKTNSEFFDPQEKFIWDMKEDITGNLICAVGNSGGVYRIDKNGDGIKIFSSEDTHIISLYITRGNSILAGSGDRGVLYRIDNRKTKVLFDSPLDEIRGICEDKDGNIYFSATSGLNTDSEAKPSAPKTIAKNQKDNPKEPTALEKSILYRLNTNGSVEQIWASRTEYIYTLYYEEKSKSVIFGTGNSGRVYRILEDNSSSILYESESAHAYKIAGKQNGFTLISNNTAAIVQVENTLNSSGTYYSDVYDLEIQSHLGRLYWEAQTPPQTTIQLYIRTGNSNFPDSTWTQWSPPFTEKDNSIINNDDCRYFQIKAVLNASGSADTPYLESFKVFYLQANLSPKVKQINVMKPSPVIVKSGDTIKKTVKTNTLEVKWQASDLNNDKLKYNVFIKKYNTQKWFQISEDITETKLSIDTRLYQDGKYILRIDADDALANPPAMAKTHRMESSSFLIDSTAPVVGGFSATGGNIQFTVNDETSIVAKVYYSFEGKLWFPVFPEDMICDSKNETFGFKINSMQNKTFIFLKVVDQFDNAKVFQEEI